MNYRPLKHSTDIYINYSNFLANSIVIYYLLIIYLHQIPLRGQYFHLNFLEARCIYSCRISAPLRVYHAFSGVSCTFVYKIKEACDPLKRPLSPRDLPHDTLLCLNHHNHLNYVLFPLITLLLILPPFPLFPSPFFRFCEDILLLLQLELCPACLLIAERTCVCRI